MIEWVNYLLFAFCAATSTTFPPYMSIQRENMHYTKKKRPKKKNKNKKRKKKKKKKEITYSSTVVN